MLCAIEFQIRNSIFWDGVTKRLITHKKLLPIQCDHIVSDCRDAHPAKNYDEHYSPLMVQVAKNYRVWLMAEEINIGCKEPLPKLSPAFGEDPKSKDMVNR